MITGERIILRPWKEADIPALMGLRNDVALQQQLLSRARGSQESDVRAWLTACSTQSDQLFFVVANRSDNLALGYLQLRQLNLLDRKAELGICLSREVQERGLGREAIETAFPYLAGTWALRKIHLRVLAENAPAIRCYEHCGFVQCGLHKRDIFLGGGWRDVMLMERFLDDKP